SVSATAFIPRRFSQVGLASELSRLTRIHPTCALLLLDVALEEVVEKSADHGDRTDASDRLPAGTDGGLDDVGGELKSEAGDQPARISQPGLTGSLIAERLEGRTRNFHRYLDRPDEYDEQRQRVDQHDHRFTDDVEPLSHALPSPEDGYSP